MKTHTKLRSYRFSEKLANQLNQLKKYSIIESKFVRLAIQEKLDRDLPFLEKNIKTKNKEYCPF